MYFVNVICKSTFAVNLSESSFFSLFHYIYILAMEYNKQREEEDEDISAMICVLMYISLIYYVTIEKT